MRINRRLIRARIVASNVVALSILDINISVYKIALDGKVLKATLHNVAYISPTG